MTNQCQLSPSGRRYVRSSVMLIIAKISSRVSPLSFLTLSNDNASNVSSIAGDYVTLLVRSSF